MNESYIALARKYRPGKFSELIGQEVLVNTLSNAIRNNKLHHAYILTGIRGVGKTSTARIIAKTINCTDEEASKEAKCCNECDNCKKISSYSHHDVIEMDAASRTGVDDIREIIESIAYAPISAKYKIYIIDEVHMLSNSAFNALLKTLEEPPEYVKFIFATTEIKKVPITILSRCQKFDLRRMNDDEISSHVSNILKKEEYEFPETIPQLIAKYSEGSVRDSLSLTDQFLSLNNFEKKLELQKLNEMLGIGNRSLIVNLFNSIINSQYDNSLKEFEKIYETSNDLREVITQMLTITSAITKNKITDSEIYDFDQESCDILKSIQSKISINALNIMWKVLSNSYDEISRSPLPKLCLEMTIARLCFFNQESSTEEGKNDKKILENYNDKCDNKKQEADLAHEIMQNFAGAKII